MGKVGGGFESTFFFSFWCLFVCFGEVVPGGAQIRPGPFYLFHNLYLFFTPPPFACIYLLLLNPSLSLSLSLVELRAFFAHRNSALLSVFPWSISSLVVIDLCCVGACILVAATQQQKKQVLRPQKKSSTPSSQTVFLPFCWYVNISIR